MGPKTMPSSMRVIVTGPALVPGVVIGGGFGPPRSPKDCSAGVVPGRGDGVDDVQRVGLVGRLAP